jgi:hypothetical protein
MIEHFFEYFFISNILYINILYNYCETLIRTIIEHSPFSWCSNNVRIIAFLALYGIDIKVDISFLSVRIDLSLCLLHQGDRKDRTHGWIYQCLRTYRESCNWLRQELRWVRLMCEREGEKCVIMIKMCHEGGTNQIRPKYRPGPCRNFPNIKLSRNGKKWIKWRLNKA